MVIVCHLKMTRGGQQVVKVKISDDVEIYLDQTLMYQLDTLVYNINKDWDFIVIVTGDRMVRTGKSVIAMNIAAYLAYRLKTPFSIKNIHFESKDMIDFAQDAPTNSVVVYDEGREGLAASKTAKSIQKDLLDYFAECGQLNHIFIVVLPDFFELKENIAVGRSEYLVNVWRREENVMREMYNDGTRRPVVAFRRGYFEFFSKKKKQFLYDLSRSTKKKTYQLIKPNFKGRFTNYYPIDEAEYRLKKKEALARFKEKKAEELKNTKAVDPRMLNAIKGEHEGGASTSYLANKYSVAERTMRGWLKQMRDGEIFENEKTD